MGVLPFFCILIMDRVLIVADNFQLNKNYQSSVYVIHRPNHKIPTVGNLIQEINTKRAALHLPAVVNLRTLNGNDIWDCFLQNYSFRLDQLKNLPMELDLVTSNKEFNITSECRIDLGYFTLIRQIGSGSFSTVILAEAKYDRRLLAIKILNRRHCDKVGERSYLVNEFQIMKALRNRSFIAKLYYAFEDIECLYLVMQYYPRGDLYQFLTGGKLSQNQARIYFVQILLAINSVHSLGYVYCDLKPENILIDNEGYLKLADFGFSKKTIHEIVKGICGSYEYMAPEMLALREYTYSYDIYSLGILLFQMIVGRTPFNGAKKQTILAMHQKGIQFPGFMGSKVKDLIKKMTLRDPKARIGSLQAIDILKHEWFSNSEEIRLISLRKLTNKFALTVSNNKQPAQIAVKELESEKIGLYYNFLQPDFDVQEIKMGPKLDRYK